MVIYIGYTYWSIFAFSGARIRTRHYIIYTPQQTKITIGTGAMWCNNIINNKMYNEFENETSVVTFSSVRSGDDDELDNLFRRYRPI